MLKKMKTKKEGIKGESYYPPIFFSIKFLKKLRTNNKNNKRKLTIA